MQTRYNNHNTVHTTHIQSCTHTSTHEHTLQCCSLQCALKLGGGGGGGELRSYGGGGLAKFDFQGVGGNPGKGGGDFAVAGGGGG